MLVLHHHQYHHLYNSRYGNHFHQGALVDYWYCVWFGSVLNFVRSMCFCTAFGLLLEILRGYFYCKRSFPESGKRKIKLHVYSFFHSIHVHLKILQCIIRGLNKTSSRKLIRVEVSTELQSNVLKHCYPTKILTSF